jgi:hypothetical protein
VGTAKGPVDGARAIQGPFEMMDWIFVLASGQPGALAVETLAGSAASVSGKWQATR